ncbi:unnamed protein product, partial [Durusdinium trenchii]
VRFSCTAWLLSHHPELSVEGLSDRRQRLLTESSPSGRILHDQMGELTIDLLEPPLIEHVTPVESACGSEVGWCQAWQTKQALMQFPWRTVRKVSGRRTLMK